ncbi:pseudouridine synthase, RluA family [Candidatus Hodgkinia cicadicola]|nr:pseudouridine synthase, RluA family [Candidatus Hodgkinia cicadicola]
MLCRSPFGVGLAHRLDYGTCGLIIGYKTYAMRTNLIYQFYKKNLIKKYISLAATSGAIKFSNLCHSANLSTLYVNALTFKLLDHKLIIGKRHQIRLTYRHICGDRTYCAKLCTSGVWSCLISSLRHQCLTSYISCLYHVGGLLTFECGLRPLFRYVLINFLKLSALRV